VDHQSCPGVRPEKGARDRLIRLAQRHPDWVVGFEDEVWWSRVAQPRLSTWSEDGQPLRLLERPVLRDDPDPKALACYGLLVRSCMPTPTSSAAAEQVWLRFVEHRPVSAATTQFLHWCCERLAAAGKRALLLVWDHASWHLSALVRQWLREHNRQVKQTGNGVRIVVSALPVKSPWLNPIEPKWVHGKRAVLEPARLLTARELEDRICAYYSSKPVAHLSYSEKVP
jgi:DDE superfamily endonuclease